MRALISFFWTAIIRLQWYIKRFRGPSGACANPDSCFFMIFFRTTVRFGAIERLYQGYSSDVGRLVELAGL